ncbi:MAG TPA: helix-turn-helix transcriptional regulator, partial [Anaerolineales bacterium]|nr:helix-turn-helix transcriptional regulator [Anaerolineales bacterium]
TYSRYSLGALYLDLMAYSQAQEQLDGALKLANQIGSRWWITNITGFLALLHISKKDFELAASALDAALGISVDSFLHEKNEIRAATMGQRLCWYACAQLALARDDADTALYIVDQLLDSSANLTEEGLIPRLGILRGEALAVFRRTAEAEKVLLATRKVVERQSEKPYLWRIYVTLGKVYQLSGQREDALSAFAIAQTVIAELSTKIPDDSLRENFAKHALALLPGSQKLSPRQVAKQESGGLTEREREVAQMVAQGKSNHEIAGALVVSERTVETHVGNILTKLGFSSRSQVAAWVVEKGLLKEN